MAAESYVIQTDGLGKTYGEVLALSGLDLKVPKNSIFAFLGPNGAGKTTTIKLLLGLTRPTEGTATVLGRNIINDNDEIRRNVGYLAQQPKFYKELSARETLRFAASLFFKGPQNLIEERIEYLREILFRYSCACVCNGNRHRRAEILDRDTELSAVRHRLVGINNQVVEDLLES